KAFKRIQNQSGVAIVLKTARDVISISSNKIYFVEVYDHDLIYHTEQGEFRARGQLSEVRKKLNDEQFILCNRSYLVNLRYINSVHDNHLVVNGESVQISKSHRKEIEKRFVSYLGENL
ncbi:MAG: LytTR family DNA-binding domain-containing protein, partial [Clostridia bacterium]